MEETDHLDLGMAREGARRRLGTTEVERLVAALADLKIDERRAPLMIAAGYSYAEIGRIYRWTRAKVNRCAAEGRAPGRAIPADLLAELRYERSFD